MADTYIDVPATPGSLRAALIAEASGVAGSWKVFRLATGTHENDLDSNSIREKNYFRITAADGATPRVVCTTAAGLALYNNANHWQVDTNVTWECAATSPNAAFTLLCNNTGWMQNLDFRCAVVANANTKVITVVEPGGADFSFTGSVTGGSTATTYVAYGFGVIGGAWTISAVIDNVFAVVNPRCAVTAYVIGCRVTTFRRLVDADALSSATVITYNNLLLDALGSAIEGVWHMGAGVGCATKLRAWHNTLVGATGKALYHNFSGGISELKFQNNILCEVTQGTDYQAKANFTQGGNIARACAFNGGSGGGDYTVVAPELVGFTNEAGGDYSLLYGAGTAPDLRKAFDHCSDVGVATDIIGTARPQGAAYDAGCYEATPPLDCEQVSIGPRYNDTLRVTFAAVEYGTAKPLQASAQTPGNWTLTTNVALGTSSYSSNRAVAVNASAKVSNYVYDITLSREMIPGEVISVDTSGITTDQGGHC